MAALSDTRAKAGLIETFSTNFFVWTNSKLLDVVEKRTSHISLFQQNPFVGLFPPPDNTNKKCAFGKCMLADPYLVKAILFVS